MALHRCARCSARTSYVENGLCSRCLTVRRVDYGPALACLGRNLATAGALAWSYDLGWYRGAARNDTGATFDEYEAGLRATWLPNAAGRPAPGTGGT